MMDPISQFTNSDTAGNGFPSIADYGQFPQSDEQFSGSSLEYEGGGLSNALCPAPPGYGYSSSPSGVSMEYVHGLYALHYPGGDLPSENMPYGGRANSTSDGKRKRRRIITLDQRKAANIRERRRMFHLNEAFDQLRKRVPTFAYEKKLSRIETLKLAVTYIEFMSDMLHGSSKDGSNTPSSRSSTDLHYLDDSSSDDELPIGNDPVARFRDMSDPSSPGNHGHDVYGDRLQLSHS